MYVNAEKHSLWLLLINHLCVLPMKAQKIAIQSAGSTDDRLVHVIALTVFAAHFCI